MSEFLCKTICLASLLLPVFAIAQDDDVEAAISLGIGDDEEIWAGQQVTLNLDLKSTGFSFSNSHFNLPEVDGAFLMQTDTTTIKLTEKINGQIWQVIRYPLALYPQKSGQLEIPPIDVRFTTSAGFGSAEKAFEFQSTALAVAVKQPPGVKKGDLVITTSSFELNHNWHPESGAKHTGDAITLTVNRSASDISAMLLPPLPVFRSPGLAAYPQAAEISDKTNRGDLTGERTDTIIWVVEKPGVYEIPGVRFQWWDPNSRELEEQIIPGFNLDITPSPADRSAAATSTPARQESRSLLPILLVLTTGLLTIAFWFRFGRKNQDRQPDQEKSAFTALQKACKNNQAAQAHAAIHTWLTHSSYALSLNPVTLNEFARRINDKPLAVELEKLQEALLSPNEKWQGAVLSNSMQNIRQKIRAQKKVQSKTYLAPLNP